MRFTFIQMMIIMLCVFTLGSTGFYYLLQRVDAPKLPPDKSIEAATLQSTLTEPDTFPLEKNNKNKGNPSVETRPQESETLSSSAPVGKIDLNKATREEIKKITGLSAELCDAIILFREEGMFFKGKDDLLKIDGFSTEIVNRIEPVVYFSQQTPIQTKSKEETITQTDSRKDDGLININTASSSELQKLPRVGPKTAEKIISYRESHGPFKNPEQITNVQGIGPKTYEKMKNMIKVQD